MGQSIAIFKSHLAKLLNLSCIKIRMKCRKMLRIHCVIGWCDRMDMKKALNAVERFSMANS